MSERVKVTAEAGYKEINVLMVTLLVLSLAFLVISKVKGERSCLRFGWLSFLIITSVMGYIIPLAAGLHSAPELDAGILVLLASTAPVFAVIAVLLLRSEKVTLARMLAVPMGLLSVLLVLWPELSLPGWGKAYWILIALVIPMVYGLESVYIDIKWPDGMSSLQAVTGETVMATLLVIPFFLFMGDVRLPAYSWGTPELAIAVFLAAGVCESLIYFYLIRVTGGVFISFGGFITLFAGMAWGMFLFGERHPPSVWASVVLLTVALLFAMKTKVTDEEKDH